MLGRFVVPNVESPPYTSRSFEAVVRTEMFEHVGRPQRISCEMAHALTPGGMMMNTLSEERWSTSTSVRSIGATARFPHLAAPGGFIVRLDPLALRRAPVSVIDAPARCP